VIPAKPGMPTPWAALAALEAARWNAPQDLLSALRIDNFPGIID